MRELRRRWPLILFAVAASLALLWPAFINGQPFIFDDTTNYVRGADAAAYRLTGIDTAWTHEFVARYGELDTLAARNRTPRATADLPVTLSGRSVYYGALLYLSQAVDGFWLAALFQAVLTGLAILFTWERLARPSGAARRYGGAFLIVALIAALTPAAYFASFAMPDIFAPLGLLALAHLLFFPDRDSRARRLFWFALLLFALLAHSANILLFGGLFVLCLAGRLLGRLPIRRGALVAVVLAIVLGIGGEALFSATVRGLTGAPPVRPPFLMARIIDDGPGYRFLRDTCPGNGFSVCRYLPILPLNSDAFLWTKAPGRGVFQASPPAERRALAHEETAFVLAVARARPFDLASSALRSTIAQISFMGLSEFNYRHKTELFLHEKLPPAEARRQAGTAAIRDAMPTRAIARITPALTAASLAFLAVAAALACPAIRRSGTTGALGGFALLVLAGVLLNDVIAGTMSTPHDRYQARIIWLLPLLALCALPATLAAWERRRQKPAPQAPLATD